MIPEAVTAWAEQQGHGAIVSSNNVSGGCISAALCLKTASGTRLFLKSNDSVPDNFFAAEAAGLTAMRHTKGPLIPQVYLFKSNFILMEYLEPGSTSNDYWQRFGRELAVMHNCTDPSFGFSTDSYCGSTLQDNTKENDGFHFFAERRLMHLAKLNLRNGELQQSQVDDLQALCNKLPEIIPEQPASLLHGDLWSGNAHTGPKGEPALIDPACY